jgi:hypothetical protein
LLKGFAFGMTSLKCQQCGAELIPRTSFCRKCGAAISGDLASESSELPTAILGEGTAATTERLQARHTSPARIDPVRSRVRFKVVIAALAVIMSLLVVAGIAVLSDRNEGTVVNSAALMYPGAQTIVDMKSDVGRTLQLQTSDSLDRVESWYHNNFKLNKIIRLSTNNVILKNDKLVITLAVEDNKTNILIKQGV